MINRPTCLILGAGASMPYGFPSGKALKEEICDKLQSGYLLYDQLIQLGHSQDFIAEFIHALKYSAKKSIDSFLEHRQEYQTIGKMAIAFSILARENLNAMFFTQQESKIPRSYAVDYARYWYDYLFEKIGGNPKHFQENKLKILTFNYDRSLETFLYHSFKNSYNLSDEDCRSFLAHLEIIHLHGTVAKNIWDAPTGKEYPQNGESRISLEDLKLSVDNIKIVHEALPTSPEFARAREILNQSTSICFFGFSYHTDSLERLDFKSLISQKEFHGTAYGMGKQEVVNVKSYFDLIWLPHHPGHPHKVQQKIRMGTETEGTIDYLKNYSI